MNWKLLKMFVSVNELNFARKFANNQISNSVNRQQSGSYNVHSKLSNRFKFVFFSQKKFQQIVQIYKTFWKQYKLPVKGIRKVLMATTGIQYHGSKKLLLGACGAYMFDSNSDRFSFNIINQFLSENELLEKVQSDALMCHNCRKDQSKTNASCKCPANISSIFLEASCWEPYLERDNIKIWRKEEKPANYSYKVYAKYDDITPNDFLHVQTNIEYRKQWDDTVAELAYVDGSDSFDKTANQIIYWETHWPRLFANRDYVYCRKVFIDQRKNWIIICNKSTTHPKCPPCASKHRVNEYWSYMIIKPQTTFNEPGLEYVLIYYDDPGLAIPSTVTSWIAQTQMPNFLYKLYIATKNYASKK